MLATLSSHSAAAGKSHPDSVTALSGPTARTRSPVGAVVQHAGYAAARRIRLGLHPMVTGGRTSDLFRRVGIDAAGISRAYHYVPHAIGPLHLQDGTTCAAVSMLASSLDHLGEVLRLLLLRGTNTGEHQFLVGIFAVMQGIAPSRHRQIAKIVVVVAELQFLRGRGLLQRISTPILNFFFAFFASASSASPKSGRPSAVSNPMVASIRRDASRRC